MVSAVGVSVEKRTASENSEIEFGVSSKLPKVGNISLAETLLMK